MLFEATKGGYCLAVFEVKGIQEYSEEHPPSPTRLQRGVSKFVFLTQKIKFSCLHFITLRIAIHFKSLSCDRDGTACLRSFAPAFRQAKSE